jgi:hypothetical protein
MEDKYRPYADWAMQISDCVVASLPPPKPVGYWIIDPPGSCAYHTLFSVYNKPTDQQIKNTEEAFGWKWKDA